jgi:hypothetical protein
MATVTQGYTWTSGETVTPAKLNSAAAPTVVVADNEVTTAKILDANVTNAKLATGIDASKLTTGTLPIARVADAAITAPKLQNGVTLQTVYAQTTTAQFIDVLIPADNTKPQNTEGEEVITATITPSSNTNKVLVEALITGTRDNGAGGTIIVALFKDSDASAIATTHCTSDSGYAGQISLVFQHSPATTSSVTYKIRAGYTAGGTGFVVSGHPTIGNVYDGTMISCIKLTEIKA